MRVSAGVSHVAVLRAIKQGRVPARSGRHRRSAESRCLVGTRDRSGARQERSRKLRPRSFGLSEKQRVGSVRETLKEQGLPAGGNVTFVQARTAHEIAKAHLARLRLQRMKGELVERARATALVFRLAREERDSWLNWPARVAALIAADLGVDAHAVQKIVEAHVRGHLAELAEVRPEFR